MQAFELIQAQRRLSYREFGNPSGENILVCLPGILENQSSFDALVPFFKAQNDTRVVTIDLCGRGQSDWLAPTQRYSMQQYSEDLKQFLAHLHATHQRKQRKMHLLGTSMGAILAMHLASDVDLKVHSIILNDIALSVSWLSLYKLSGKLQKALAQSERHQLSQALEIDPQLLIDIEHPRHLDVPYQYSLAGLSFHALVNKYKGRIMLIRGANSEVCTDLDHIHFIQTFSRSKTLTVPQAAHPVPYTTDVLQGINHFIHETSGSFDRHEFSITSSDIPQEPYLHFVVNRS